MLAIIFSFLTLLGSGQQNLKIENAWIRPANKGMNSAMYFTIENNSAKADTLYKAASNSAELVQIHETFMKNGLMGMKEVEFIVVPSHSSVTFKPGGYHVMFIKLKKDFKINSREEAYLYFKSGAKIKVLPIVKIQK